MKQYSIIEDFIAEFRWYQKRGIAPNVTESKLEKIWKDAPTIKIKPEEFDKYINFAPYREKIKGSIKDRIRIFLDIASREDRSETFDTKWEKARSVDPGKYLLDLADLVYSGYGYPPVNIVDINNKARIIAGGRTRAAISKALGVPVSAKIIKIKHEGNFSDKAKRILKIS
jgi:hypothetical protein